MTPWRGKIVASTALGAPKARAMQTALLAAATCGMAALAAAGAPPSVGGAPSAAAIPGVADAQRAWQRWTLNCQGCHRPDGTGSEGAAPSLAGSVAKFLKVRGGRDYLGRVPGVATSPLSNADLAEVMNWMLWRFDREHIPTDFQPFTADEVGRLRVKPLRTEASSLRRDLLKKADRSAPR